MRRNAKLAIIAIVLGVALSLIPYIIVYSSTGGNPFAASPAFFDDFENQILNSKWQFVDPLGGSSVDLTTKEGWLTINTFSPPHRDITDGPRLVLSDITGDFNITTKVQLSLASPNGSAGIIAWEDNEHYVYLHDTLGQGNTILFSDMRITIAKDARYAYYGAIDLILSKKGDDFTASYISQGIESIVETISFPINGPLDVGISAASTTNGNFTAFFDYVSLNS